MKKIIFILTILTLALVNLGTELYSQQETQRNKDTLIVGGIYRILLSNGRDFTGEITSNRDSTIGIRVGNENFYVTKDKIIAIANTDAFDESEIESNRTVLRNNKFKLLGSVQAGVSIPSGDFSEVYSTSSGFQVATYGFFSKFLGFGAEFQYNHFHGPQDYYTKWDTSGYNNIYYNTKYESGNFYSYMLKMNLMLGNLNPNSKFVFYGLIGLGLQLNNVGDGKYTQIYYSNYTSESGLEENAEFAFMFGFGAGSFYKISKKIGINLEFQYNKLPSKDYNNYYGYYGYYGYNGYDGYNESDGSSGFFSIRAGIMYTNF